MDKLRESNRERRLAFWILAWTLLGTLGACALGLMLLRVL